LVLAGLCDTPPDSLAVFKGPTSKGKEGEGEEKRKREGKREGEGNGREGRGRPYTPPVANSWLRHCLVCLSLLFKRALQDRLHRHSKHMNGKLNFDFFSSFFEMRDHVFAF